FHVTGLTNEGEPVGAQGVPLTPGRSIAVDRVHEYGTPFFIEANLPIESGKPVSPFLRLMIAQDTGSALVRPARPDLYWGAADHAGRLAGRCRQPGRFAMLVPRELDLVAAGRQMPLPVPKPKIPEVDTTDGKGKVPSTDAGATAAGKELAKHPASPAPKPKMAASDVASDVKTHRNKEDGKGTVAPAHGGATAAGKELPKPPAWPAPKPKMAASDVKRDVRKEDGKGRATSANTGATAAGKELPKHPASPAPKPKMAASDVKKDVKKEDGKGKAPLANTGATVTGKQPPKRPASPAPKPKAPAIEVKKRDGKGKANSANSANSGEDWRA